MVKRTAAANNRQREREEWRQAFEEDATADILEMEALTDDEYEDWGYGLEHGMINNNMKRSM